MLSEVLPQTVQWFWDGRIPAGELTTLDADPGTGKTTLLMDLAARCSAGLLMPDDTSGPSGGVLLLTAEDSLPKTIVQRLDAAGADRSRIVALHDSMQIPNDLDEIEATAREVDAKLLIIDPLMAFLSRDANGEQKVRRAMGPLRRFAERTNVAVVMVRHFTKRGSGNPLYRGMGSIGIVASTRSALFVGRSPDDPSLRVLCHVKSNLGPLAPSLLFEPAPGEQGVVQIDWRGECDYTWQDVLAPPTTAVARLAEASSFLLEVLAEGPVQQKRVKQLAIDRGLAWRTVQRANEVLGVVSKRIGFGPGSQCFWNLPDAASA